MAAILRLPLFLMLLGLFSVSAIVPAGFALTIGDFHDARSFFYAGLLGLFVTAMVGLALANRTHNRSAMRQLLGLMAGFVALPLFLAVPFYDALRNTTFLSAYFEMLSCLTTTGATLFDASRLSGPEHLWRAQVGWLGGLMIWVAAAAILAPMALGGFEVTSTGAPGQAAGQGAARGGQHDPAARLWRSVAALAPIYVGLTLGLCFALLVAREDPLVALIHAMGVMASSGITTLDAGGAGGSGLAGEALLFVFMGFSLSRLTFSGDTGLGNRTGLLHDPEFRLGLVIVAAVPIIFFSRHWAAAFEVGEEENITAGLRALWGGLFTAMSFLTTTGYLSAEWQTAQSWSGLPTPGLVLSGLAIVGGGVATTAGGVKLLRVYALYLNGKREIERLIHPNSVGKIGASRRRIARHGAFIAWISFMMFALTLALVSMALSLFGIGFEDAMVLTVAALANTGPIAAHAGPAPIDLISLADEAKLILCAAMVLGRLELLAIVVMLSPDAWRG